nr:phage tail tape measure protein [Streptomyces sp. SID5910]
MRAGIAPPDATEAQLESLATKVSDVATTFDLDLGQTANAVGQAIKTGIAKDGTEALDIFAAGLQKMGPRADDLMDTFNEYSVQFQRLGLDAQTATGLISQGMQAGARDTDVVADALKEFTLEGVQGSDKIVQGFKDIGLNADDMTKKISKGGPDATEALQKTLDTLRGMEDPIKRDAAATALFGTKSEDMQKALLALDPSKAVAALGQVGGTAEQMGNTLRDNAGAQVEAFKRQAMQGLVDFLGTTVIPKLMEFVGFLRDHQTELYAFAAVITAVAVPALLLLGGKALWAGMQMARAWVIGLGPIGWVGLAIGALVVLVIAYWDEVKAWTLAAWDWVVAKVSGAKDGVLDAVGYLGQIPGMVGGYFGDAKDKAVEKSLALVAWMQGLPGRTGSAISGLGGVLSSAASRYWQQFKTGSINKARETVSWLTGLPRQMGAAVGDLSQLLYSKGTDVVRGLWQGIKSMGSWLKDTLIGWAKSIIPGPVAKALGIASPSKVMRDRIGRWIPAGIVEGIRSGEGAVARTMANLVPTPTLPQLGSAYAGAAGAYGSTSPFGGSTAGGATVHVEHWHAAENEGPDDNAKALAWLAKARG